MRLNRLNTSLIFPRARLGTLSASLRIPLVRLVRLHYNLLQSLAKQGCLATLSQLHAKLKGPYPLFDFSALGEAKAFLCAKSHTSSKVKALSVLNLLPIGLKPLLSVPGGTKVTSGEACALSGTKFTAFKAKLVSCEDISIKAEASMAQATDESSAFCGANVASGEANNLGGNKFKAFIRLNSHLAMIRQLHAKLRPKLLVKLALLYLEQRHQPVQMLKLLAKLALFYPEQRH